MMAMTVAHSPPSSHRTPNWRQTIIVNSSAVTLRCSKAGLLLSYSVSGIDIMRPDISRIEK